MLFSTSITNFAVCPILSKVGRESVTEKIDAAHYAGKAYADGAKECRRVDEKQILLHAQSINSLHGN